MTNSICASLFFLFALVCMLTENYVTDSHAYRERAAVYVLGAIYFAIRANGERQRAD